MNPKRILSPCFIDYVLQGSRYYKSTGYILLLGTQPDVGPFVQVSTKVLQVFHVVAKPKNYIK